MTSTDPILDFSKPFDITYFDQLVTKFYEQGDAKVQATLVQFQNHAQSWTRVDAILDKSQNINAKILACGVLEQAVKFKWKSLPKEQREGIKSYIVNIVIKLSSNPQTAKSQSLLVRKLNNVLIEIVKHEWPQNWPNFIPELVNSSKTSQTLCANNMSILLLLSEEIFDFSKGQMTQDKMKEMKKNLNKEFTLIFQLCDYILDNSQDQTLLSTTLRTLLRFLHWIPVGFIFETKLIQTLALKFFPVALFQNDTLQCLSEIGALPSIPTKPEYNSKFIYLFVAVIQQVSKLLTTDTDLAKVYQTGDPTVQTFVRHLAIFIQGFLASHLSLVESTEDSRRVLHVALGFLLRISQVSDVTVFKICLDYWLVLVTDLFRTQQSSQPTQQPLQLAGLNKPAVAPRIQFYQEILTSLRKVMIAKMAKPEEVLVVEDEHGEIVRETLQDTDAIILYKEMREILIFLTHLDPSDAQETMLTKLMKQVDGSEFEWNRLNSLCWAIGSISGALSEMQEKTFLVRVIKDLLGLCEIKRGKDHKAVIASNIMYVVGQYPRFLRQHWKFLKTVVNKLFEFMHEKHPGVQDMSCDTFLKIARKCKRRFVVTQSMEGRPFIEDILDELPKTIKDLEQNQIHTFYEACGMIISAQSTPETRQLLIFKLMELPNQSWAQVISQANSSPETMWNLKTVKSVVLVLKSNNRVASSVGSGYMVQLGRIYLELLQIYKMYSQYISQQISQHGVSVTKTLAIKSMRAVKKETLKLLQTFVNNSMDSEKEIILRKFVPALLDPILDDYKRNVAEARDSEVLTLFSTLVDKLQGMANDMVPRVFESLFQCTLEMITKNFEDFPDHRIMFFRLLRSANAHCFPTLLKLHASQFKLIIDSVVWAFKHLEKNIADTGLNILLEVLNNVQSSDISNDFYKGYFLSLLQDILGVLTDTFHKPGLRLHSQILQKLFHVVESGSITISLSAQHPNNQAYIRHVTTQMLRTSFVHLSSQTIDQFVAGLFSLSSKPDAVYKTHLRDFLIQLKEFAGKQGDLYEEERAAKRAEEEAQNQARIKSVPGLLYTTPRTALNQPKDKDEIL